MRVKGEYVESSEIADIAVTTTMTGKQVFVRDLATVRDTIKDLSLDEKINRHDGARIIISKQTGANTVAIARQVKAEMEQIRKTLPPDIEFTLIRDGSEEIINAINGLTESIFYALLFVVLVVLVFLGNWRSTVIIALTIPISLVTSFIYLLLADSSLNIISLASLTVAIGMVVDDAIVVLVSMFLDGLAYLVDAVPRLGSLHANLQALLGDTHQLLFLRRGLTDDKHSRSIGIVTVEDGRKINVDDIALLQDVLCLGNTVTHHLVDAGTDTHRERRSLAITDIIVQTGGNGMMLRTIVATDLVYLQR